MTFFINLASARPTLLLFPVVHYPISCPTLCPKQPEHLLLYFAKFSMLWILHQKKSNKLEYIRRCLLDVNAQILSMSQDCQPITATISYYGRMCWNKNTKHHTRWIHTSSCHKHKPYNFVRESVASIQDRTV